MPQRIQRKRTKGWRMPEGAIYVGRPTKWGNPFSVGHHFVNRGPWSDAPYPDPGPARERDSVTGWGEPYREVVSLVANRQHTYEYRTRGVDEPISTLRASGNHHGVVQAPPFIAELRGGGSDARSTTHPLSTVTASGNHHGLVMWNNTGEKQ